MGYKSLYFREEEFKDKTGRESPYPHTVQDDLYDLCDRIRMLYGRPLVVSSGYRSPEHNKEVGGKPNSLHLEGKAADLQPLQKDKEFVDVLHFYAKAVNMQGGIGLYDWGVHVDIRGTKAMWDYRTKKGKNEQQA